MEATAGIEPESGELGALEWMMSGFNCDEKELELLIDFRRRSEDISWFKLSILAPKASISLCAYPSSLSLDSEETESLMVSNVDLDSTMQVVSPTA